MLRARLYYDMCAPLLRHVRTSTSTSMYVHVRDQNDNATYASTRWVPTVRHFLACEDVAGGSQQSGGESFFLPWRTSLRAKMQLVGPSRQGGRIIFFFARTQFLACEGVAGGSQQPGGNVFSAKYGGRLVGPRFQVDE